MSRSNSPNELTITQAALEIAQGRLSALELTDACIARIKQSDPEIGAWVHFDAGAARKQAQTADARQASGAKLGPLHGIPIGIKDIIDTKDMPTQNGCPIFKGNTPGTEAPCVSKLKEAGALILGKTVTTELALLTPAATKNPVDTGRTPGGSSAGSAAAVADFMVPAALGTQTAGSVLRPASYCGLYGFKPTRGLIPRAGVLMQSHTLDTVGMLTRSIPDTALLTQVMAAFDPADDVSISNDGLNLLDAASAPRNSNPRFAFVKTPAWKDADSALHKAFEDFNYQLKAIVTTIEIDLFSDILEWQRIVQIAENAFYYGPLLDASPQHISQGLTQRINAGRAESVTGYIDAIRARERAYCAIETILDDYDAIITPAAPGPAPLGFAITGSPIFNGSWTYLGTPALSMPLLKAHGLPLGVQIVGKRREDARLLQTAAWLENHYNSLN